MVRSILLRSAACTGTGRRTRKASRIERYRLRMGLSPPEKCSVGSRRRSPTKQSAGNRFLCKTPHEPRDAAFLAAPEIHDAAMLPGLQHQLNHSTTLAPRPLLHLLAGQEIVAEI